jgi:hypothetical protein
VTIALVQTFTCLSSTILIASIVAITALVHEIVAQINKKIDAKKLEK